MTTGKMAEASALQGDGTSSCYQYDICLWIKKRGIIVPVKYRGQLKTDDNLTT
jgi:hypothetical protein